MEGRHASHDADKHAHRVRVVVERLHELAEIIVDDAVAHHLLAPVRQLGLESTHGGQASEAANPVRAALSCQNVARAATGRCTTLRRTAVGRWL